MEMTLVKSLQQYNTGMYKSNMDIKKKKAEQTEETKEQEG